MVTVNQEVCVISPPKSHPPHGLPQYAIEDRKNRPKFRRFIKLFRRAVTFGLRGLNVLLIVAPNSNAMDLIVNVFRIIQITQVRTAISQFMKDPNLWLYLPVYDKFVLLVLIDGKTITERYVL